MPYLNQGEKYKMNCYFKRPKPIYLKIIINFLIIISFSSSFSIFSHSVNLRLNHHCTPSTPAFTVDKNLKIKQKMIIFTLKNLLSVQITVSIKIKLPLLSTIIT